MAIQDQIMEQLTTPDTIHNVLVIPAIAVATGLWAAYDIKGVHEGKTDTERNFDGANGPIFNKVITETETGKPFTQRAYNTWYRVGHQVLTIVGAGIITASVLTQPTVESTTHVDHGSEIAVLDSSISMLDTHDMSGGETRFDAAEQALMSLPNTVNLGVVQFGANAKNTVPLGPKNNKTLENLSNDANEVNPNGGNVADAIDLALSDLPNVGNTTKKSGEIIILSDGTVDPDSAISGSTTGNTISVEAAKATNDGVTVKVIIPGTTKGQYYYEGTGPYPDGVTPTSYISFGKHNIVTTDSSETVASSATVALNKLSATTEKQVPWYPPYVLGIGLVATGGFIASRRKRTKKS